MQAFGCTIEGVWGVVGPRGSGFRIVYISSRASKGWAQGEPQLGLVVLGSKDFRPAGLGCKAYAIAVSRLRGFGVKNYRVHRKASVSCDQRTFRGGRQHSPRADVGVTREYQGRTWGSTG